MQVSITVQGLGTIQGQIKGKLETFATRVDNAIQGAGIDTEAGAKQNCPVDTGRLRSSIKYTKTGPCKCSIGTNVKYARPIEFGHRTRNGKHVAARPFLFPAYATAKKNLLTELQSLVK